MQQYVRIAEKSRRVFYPPVCPTVSSDLPPTTHFDPDRQKTVRREFNNR